MERDCKGNNQAVRWRPRIQWHQSRDASFRLVRETSEQASGKKSSVLTGQIPEKTSARIALWEEMAVVMVFGFPQGRQRPADCRHKGGFARRKVKRSAATWTPRARLSPFCKERGRQTLRKHIIWSRISANPSSFVPVIRFPEARSLEE